MVHAWTPRPWFMPGHPKHEYGCTGTVLVTHTVIRGTQSNAWDAEFRSVPGSRTICRVGADHRSNGRTVQSLLIPSCGTSFSRRSHSGGVR